jgi:hypothetical protein
VPFYAPVFANRGFLFGGIDTNPVQCFIWPINIGPFFISEFPNSPRWSRWEAPQRTRRMVQVLS